MSFRRLEIPGHFPVPPELSVRFDEQTWGARPGEPLAYTLLAHGVYVLGRSSKYHRPRGLFCGVGTCGQCVAQCGGLSNVKLCEATHQTSRSQNTWGTARIDPLAAMDWAFPYGIDHHHFMTRFALPNRLALGFARHLAGQGALPTVTEQAVTPYQAKPQHTTVAVVGGGPAGRRVGSMARRAGLATRVFDKDALAEAHVEGDSWVIGFYDDRELVVITPQGLLRVQADIIVLATGANPQPPECPGNDVPGVISYKAALRALTLGILPGRRIALAAPAENAEIDHVDIPKLAKHLQNAGATLALTVGLGNALPDVSHHATRVTKICGCAPSLQVETDKGPVECDVFVWCGPPAPAYELAAQMGIETLLHPSAQVFVPMHAADGSTRRDGVFIAGELAGPESQGFLAALAQAERVGASIVNKIRTVDVGALA